MVDEELRRAAADLREELSQVTPPPFKPRAEVGGRVLLVAATVAVFAIGLALVVGASDRNSDPVDESDPVVTDDRQNENPDLSTPDRTDGETVFGIDTDRPTPGAAVTDLTHRPVTEMARPEFGRFVLEPEFETIIAATTTSPDGGVAVPMPDGAPSWNVDGSLLVLYETGELSPGHALYDGRTFERIAALPIVPFDIEQLHWDPVRPNRLYYTEDSTLLAFDIDPEQRDQGRASEIASLDGCQALSTQSQQPLSADGAWMGLVCTTADGSDWVILNLESGDVSRAPALSPIAPIPLADGSRFVITADDGVTSVVDKDFEPAGPSLQIETNHLLVTKTTDGRDILVTTIYDSPESEIGSVVGYDLATGDVIAAVTQESGYPYPPSGTNISSSLGANGLVVVSIRGAQSPGDQDTLDGEVLVVDFNPPDPTVYRLAHHRSEFEGAAFDVFRSTPWVAINPSGSQVLFASHWGEGRVDTFVIDIGELRSS